MVFCEESNILSDRVAQHFILMATLLRLGGPKKSEEVVGYGISTTKMRVGTGGEFSGY